MGLIESERANGLEAGIIDDGVRVVMISHAALELPEGTFGNAAFLLVHVRLTIPHTLVCMPLPLMHLQRR